ncbi:MAG TPA: hypothetical protein VIL86_12180 [Tepidisphaeraceae bacterium]|jgi:hypothetical protein
MVRYLLIAALGLGFAGITGCDRTVEEKKVEKVKSDGTRTVDEKKTTLSNDGNTVKKTEEHKVDVPP